VDDEDVDLTEFSDEIEDWVILELHKIGLDTAKQVLALDSEELIRRTELEEETVNDILTILRSEFE
jgi:N utilization substance protein A